MYLPSNNMKHPQNIGKFLAVLFIVVFGFGWITNDVVSLIEANFSEDKPLDFGTNPERSSPSDWIKKEDIHVYDDRIIIDLNDGQWAVFTDTNSMDPVLDEDSNGIEIIPESPDQIQVGDIVSYKSKYSAGTIIHRVIEKDVDEEGVYFIMKGDNNKDADPGKVRFEQIQRVLIGVLY